MAKDDRPDSTIGISSTSSDGEKSSTRSGSPPGRSTPISAASNEVTKDTDAGVIDSLSDSDKSGVQSTFSRLNSNTSPESHTPVSNIAPSQKERTVTTLKYQDISNLIRNAPPPAFNTAHFHQQTAPKQPVRSMSYSDTMQHTNRSTHVDTRRGKASRSHSSSDNGSGSDSSKYRHGKPRNISTRKREVHQQMERHHPVIRTNINASTSRSNSAMDPGRFPFISDSNTNHLRNNGLHGKENPVPMCNYQQGYSNEQWKLSVSRANTNDGAHMNRNAPVKDQTQRSRAYATSADDISSQGFTRDYKRHQSPFRVPNAMPFHADFNSQQFANNGNRYPNDVGQHGVESRTHRRSRRDSTNFTPFEIALQQFHRLAVGESKSINENNVPHPNAHNQGHPDTRRKNSCNSIGENPQMKNDLDDQTAFRRAQQSFPENNPVLYSSEHESRMHDSISSYRPPMHSDDHSNNHRQYNRNRDSTAYRSQEDIPSWRQNEYRSAVGQPPLHHQSSSQNYKHFFNRSRSSSRSRSIDRTAQRRSQINNDLDAENDRHLPQNVAFPREHMYRSAHTIAQREDSPHSRDANSSYSPMFSNIPEAEDRHMHSTEIPQHRNDYNSPPSPRSPGYSRHHSSSHQGRDKNRNTYRRYELRESTQNAPKSLKNMIQGNTLTDETRDRVMSGGPTYSESGLDSEIREEMARARNMDIPVRFDQEPEKLNPRAETFTPPREELCCDGNGYPYRVITSRGVSFFHPNFSTTAHNPNYMIPGETTIDPIQSMETQGNTRNCSDTSPQVITTVGNQVQANASYGITTTPNPALQSLTRDMQNAGDGVAQIYTNSTHVYPNTFVHPVPPFQPHIEVESRNIITNMVPFPQTVQPVAGHVPIINPVYHWHNLNYINGINKEQMTRQNTDERQNPNFGQNITLPAIGGSQPHVQHQILPSAIMHHSTAVPPFVPPQLYHHNPYNPATPAAVNHLPPFLLGNQLPITPLAEATPAIQPVAGNQHLQNMIGTGPPPLLSNNMSARTATQEVHNSTRPPFMNLQTYVALMEDTPTGSSPAFPKSFSFDPKEFIENKITKTEETEESLVKENVKNPQIVRSVVEKFVGTVKRIEKNSQIPLTESQLVEVLCGKSLSIVDDVVANYGKCNSVEMDVEDKNNKRALKISQEAEVDTHFINNLIGAPEIHNERADNAFAADAACLEAKSKSDMDAHKDQCPSPISFQYMPELQTNSNDAKQTLECPKESCQTENRSDSEESGVIISPSDALNDFNFDEVHIAEPQDDLESERSNSVGGVCVERRITFFEKNKQSPSS